MRYTHKRKTRTEFTRITMKLIEFGRENNGHVTEKGNSPTQTHLYNFGYKMNENACGADSKHMQFHYFDCFGKKNIIRFVALNCNFKSRTTCNHKIRNFSTNDGVSFKRKSLTFHSNSNQNCRYEYWMVIAQLAPHVMKISAILWNFYRWANTNWIWMARFFFSDLLQFCVRQRQIKWTWQNHRNEFRFIDSIWIAMKFMRRKRKINDFHMNITEVCVWVTRLNRIDSISVVMWMNFALWARNWHVGGFEWDKCFFS